MNIWEQKQFSDAPLKIIDGDRGVNYPKKADFLPLGHCLFLNTGNVTDRGFDFVDTSFINAERDKVLRKGKLKRFDVVLTTRGTVGNVGFYDENVSFDHVRINSGMVIFRPNTAKLEPRFLYLCLRSPLFKNQVKVLTTGSAQPQLPMRDINRIRLPIPPISEQKAIASTLGALDDKIELNRRMNKTLEAMAQTIFRDWFVDFGPTCAKMAGRKPYLTPEIWSLFPDKLDQNGKPEGWEMRSVADFASIKGGKQLSKDKITKHGLVPVFGGAGLMGYTDAHNADGYVISVGRVGAYCGQFFAHRGKAWINNNASLITQYEGISGEWLVLALRALNIDLIKKGAAQPFVSNSDLSTMKVVYPGGQLLIAFHDIISVLMLKAESNERESCVLIQTRDLLLPKLMSGEISLSLNQHETNEEIA